jgi:YfiR/HmsC-like
MQNTANIEKQALRGGLAKMLLAVAAASVLFWGEILRGDDTPAASEAQIKAVFVFNFAKYMEWPATAFPNATAPIVIGVVGRDPFGDYLQHVEGKMAQGRPFVIKHLAADSDVSGCQILFISHSEATRMREILEKTKASPILTVGEDETFAQNGGIIRFVLKNGNVRLEIDLTAAQRAGLTISSKLLAVADVVKGKAN